MSTNILANNNLSSVYSIGLECAVEELDDAGKITIIYIIFI